MHSKYYRRKYKFLESHEINSKRLFLTISKYGDHKLNNINQKIATIHDEVGNIYDTYQYIFVEHENKEDYIINSSLQLKPGDTEKLIKLKSQQLDFNKKIKEMEVYYNIVNIYEVEDVLPILLDEEGFLSFSFFNVTKNLFLNHGELPIKTDTFEISYERGESYMHMNFFSLIGGNFIMTYKGVLHYSKNKILLSIYYLKNNIDRSEESYNVLPIIEEGDIDGDINDNQTLIKNLNTLLLSFGIKVCIYSIIEGNTKEFTSLVELNNIFLKDQKLGKK